MLVIARVCQSQWQTAQPQGSTAPSEPLGAEPFAPAGRRPAGGCPAISGTFQILEGAAP